MPQPKLHASAAARQSSYRNRQEDARKSVLAAKGLPPLPSISTLPGWPRWKASVDAARALLQQALDEMNDYFNDRSESWQEGDRGDEHQQRIASMEAVIDAIAELNF
jgi:hypothetical protein